MSLSGIYGKCCGQQFGCCPGRPFEVPELYFTPLICRWNQADYRPLHMAQETAYSARVPGGGYRENCSICPCPARHIVDRKVAVVMGRPENMAEVVRLAQDPTIDEVHLLMDDPMMRRQFAFQYRKVPGIGKVRMRRAAIHRGARHFAELNFQGENVHLVE